MLVSPGTFYRGAALIMASDLAATPHSGVTVQLCGDAHLSNFGLFGSPERQLMFDINDFDETLPGPWEWDVKRLAASFEVAGRDLGFAAADRRAIVMAGVREYRERMRAAAGMRTLDAWYAHMSVDKVTGWISAETSRKRLGKKITKEAALDIAKARTRDSVRVFAKRTGEIGGELRIVRDPPLIMPIEDLVLSRAAREQTERSVRKLMQTYRRTLAHRHHRSRSSVTCTWRARWSVSAASAPAAGSSCWSAATTRTRCSCRPKRRKPRSWSGSAAGSQYRNHGQRVVAGQHLMQAATDIFLGSIRVTDIDGQIRDYYIRQFQDWKGSAQVESLRVPGATLYARVCGAALARAHARWGDRIAIATYLARRRLRPGDRRFLRRLRRPEPARL